MVVAGGGDAQRSRAAGRRTMTLVGAFPTSTKAGVVVIRAFPAQSGVRTAVVRRSSAPAPAAAVAAVATIALLAALALLWLAAAPAAHAATKGVEKGISFTGYWNDSYVGLVGLWASLRALHATGANLGDGPGDRLPG